MGCPGVAAVLSFVPGGQHNNLLVLVKQFPLPYFFLLIAVFIANLFLFFCKIVGPAFFNLSQAFFFVVLFFFPSTATREGRRE